MKQRTIVAEVSASYRVGVLPDKPICQRFEAVIEHNHSRGYHLRDWKLVSVVVDSTIYETIVAVFQLP